jgi:RNA polymerase sigma-70 factor (ECF subfamily)
VRVLSCVCIECPARLAADLDGAFPVFVEHHQDLVFGLARRWVGRPADAEDLAQDAFLRAWRALRGYGAERRAALHARGWLARIVLNLAHNRARSAPATPDAELEAAGDPPDARAPRPDRVAEHHESAREWRARLDDLPPRYRVAVELRHVDGLTYPELAEALDRPVGTVKSDVHRGVRLLRARMEQESMTAMEVAR